MTNKELSPVAAYTEKLRDDAIRAFKDHHLIEDDRVNGKWFLARKYEDGSTRGDMATEIISLRNGRLFVGGDINDCVFAYFGGHRDATPEQKNVGKVAWIGNHEGFGYIQEKAGIGMTDNGKLTEVWEADIARLQIKAFLKDLEEEKEDYSEIAYEKKKEAFKEAIGLLEDGPEVMGRHLYDSLGYDDMESLFDIGQVISPRVMYAWAACRRLCELIL